MSEVSYSPISSTGLNKDAIISKSYKTRYSLLASENQYVKSTDNIQIDNTKDVAYLTKVVNRLEQDIDFIQHEHCQMLTGLQKQIDKLREENQDLQFQLIMRSNRLKEAEMNNPIKSKDSDLNNLQINQDKVLQLKQALNEEKRKNKDLLCQLDLQRRKNEELQNVNINNPEKSEMSLITEDSFNISPEIRLTLNPLTVSTYQNESGLYIMKTPLTIEDYEMVIQTLMKKIDNFPNFRDNSSLRSFSSDHCLKVIPGIKKTLKPISRGSTSLKLGQLNGSTCSKSIGISSNQKLMPILYPKHDINKQDSPRPNNNNRMEIESRQLDHLHLYTDVVKTGSSLPALPKTNDYNQADKHRRLHLLQRKRLDQFNNRP